MKAESYKAYVNMQDVDDYTDANGYLHRNAVELKVAKIEFETPEMLSDTEFRELMSNIQKGYLIPKHVNVKLQLIYQNMAIMLHKLLIWQI